MSLPSARSDGRRTALACTLLAAIVVSGCGRLIPSGRQTVERSELKAGSYRLDKEHAKLIWKVDHLGFSSYVGRFDRFDASLGFDPLEHQTLERQRMDDNENRLRPAKARRGR